MRIRSVATSVFFSTTSTVHFSLIRALSLASSCAPPSSSSVFRKRSVAMKTSVTTSSPFSTTSSTQSSFPAIITAAEAVEKYRANSDVYKFIDGSWHLNKDREPSEEYETSRLPDASFFDIDAVSDRSTLLPHMLPSPEVFARECTKLGIKNDDHVVIYVQNACFSAARVWWTFKVFNHEKVSIIDGGIEAWKKVGGEIEAGPSPEASSSENIYENRGMNEKMVYTCEQVLDVVNTGSAQILDARAAARFKAEAPGPTCIKFYRYAYLSIINKITITVIIAKRKYKRTSRRSRRRTHTW